MKVFISWSGSRSKELANALRKWLPMVLQYAEPWVSDKDISAGERWAQAIAGELEASNFGIICVTPENLNSEWILFEAGALSKSMLDGKVIPLLFDLEQSDLSGPLSQFQAQKVDHSGFLEIVRAINKVAEKPASTDVVDQLVPVIWPQLLTTLSAIPAKPPNDKHKRSQHEILEELVTGVRGISSRFREFDPDLPERERYNRKRRMKLHPAMIEEFIHYAERDGEGEGEEFVSLLFIAGQLREDFPWIAEAFMETFREVRSPKRDNIDRSFRKLHSIINVFTRHPMMRDIYHGSKDYMNISEYLPICVEIIRHGILNKSVKRTSEDSDRDRN